MPDVTTTLLAMYQQIIGGSNAREQSALEAEAARRVIISGLTIATNGTFQFPGNVTVGGQLVVTGTLTVTGTLSVTGTFSVSGNAAVGSLTVTGNANIGGLLAVSGFGSHDFTAGGVGANQVTVRNTQAGAGNFAALVVYNDLGAQGVVAGFSSTYTSLAYKIANGCALYSVGAGGLNLAADAPGGSIRLFTGGATQRLQITPGGSVLINTTTAIFGAYVSLGVDLGASPAIGLQNIGATNTGNFLVFLNNAAGLAGFINQTAATTVAYNTSSDARLKTDRGRATDLSALRAVVVHDFTWTADGMPDRGIFAQEAQALFPRAVTVGRDDRTPTGHLLQPWMTDYSKFVPDLLAGWQAHDAALLALRTELDALVKLMVTDGSRAS